MNNTNNLKNYILNNSNKFIYLLVLFYLFFITYYNYFSVQFFIWDDKDVIFKIEQVGYSEFFKDHNWSPRWLERYVWASTYYLFQYNYSFYTLTFLIIHLLSTFTFYKILQLFFKNKNFIFLVIIFYLTYGAHDVVNTKITFFPKTLYLLIFLISIYITFKALENLSYIKKFSMIFASALLMVFVHLSSFPYLFFSEIIRFFGIIYILFKSNKDIHLSEVIKNCLLYFVIFLALAVWIGFYENNFFGKVNINSDYDISNYIKSLLNDPFNFFISIYDYSKVNLVKLYLSPFFTFFSGINNYIEIPTSNKLIWNLILKVAFYFLTISFLFLFLEKKGLFSNNYSIKHLLLIIFLCVIFSIFFLLLSSITGRQINFIFVGGLSRYAYPVSLIYSILFVSLIFFIFRNEKLRFFFFSFIVSINCFNGFIGSEYYNKLENQSKKQFSEIIWRFGDFKNPTNFYLQDHKLSFATTLQKDKDHFLLDLLYDKPRNFLDIKRFNNNFTNKNANIPEFFISIDNLRGDNQRKNIVGFKSQSQKCYEFYDANSSPNHFSSILYTFAEPLDKDNIDYDLRHSLINYKNYKYYDHFNKMKILPQDYSEVEKNICYIYQTSKKYLEIGDYKNLASLTEKTLLNVHYFNNFYNESPENEYMNLYLWKPLIIGVLINKGQNKSKLEEILNKIDRQPGYFRFKSFYKEATEYVITNNID